MRLRIEKSVVVITPSIGKVTLKDAIASVAKQSYKNIKHLIVADGEAYAQDVTHQIPHKYMDHANKLVTTSTPWNTGGQGYYGHRIYAAYPHLIDAEYIMFLDEDNWYKPNHVESLVDMIETAGAQTNFAYSLRSIYDESGKYLLDDNCESLGKWPIWLGSDPNYLIDTSSFLFKSEFIKKTCQYWHWGWGGDRHYLYSVIETSNPFLDYSFVCSKEHTLAYRLDGNPNSVTEGFFINGNRETLNRYNGVLPWSKTIRA